MSKISENRPARIAEIVKKWKNYAKGNDFSKKNDYSNPLTCSHEHCDFWRNKSATLKRGENEEEED